MDTSPVPAQSIVGSNKYKNALIVTLGLTGESIPLLGKSDYSRNRNIVPCPELSQPTKSVCEFSLGKIEKET